MTEEKIKKITVASTVCAVCLLFVLLFVFLVPSLISMGAKKKQLAEYEEEKQRYQELIENASDDLALNKELWVIVSRARELGYRFPDDIDITKEP